MHMKATCIAELSFTRILEHVHVHAWITYPTSFYLWTSDKEREMQVYELHLSLPCHRFVPGTWWALFGIKTDGGTGWGRCCWELGGRWYRGQSGKLCRCTLLTLQWIQTAHTALLDLSTRILIHVWYIFQWVLWTSLYAGYNTCWCLHIQCIGLLLLYPPTHMKTNTF